jgi:hypothetical protein
VNAPAFGIAIAEQREIVVKNKLLAFAAIAFVLGAGAAVTIMINVQPVLACTSPQC